MVFKVAYQQTTGFTTKLFKAWYNRALEKGRGVPPYLHVTQIGDPVLRVSCDAITKDLFGKPELKCLVERLKQVLGDYGSMGLSAPQIGIDLQVFVIEFNSKHMKAFSAVEKETKELSIIPLTVFINPSLKITDYNKATFSEGCESVKGFVGDVDRYKGVEVTGFDEDGKKFTKTFNGWAARIVQHEMDHLNGVLYTDIMCKKTLSCGFWEQVNKANGRVELLFRP